MSDAWIVFGYAGLLIVALVISEIVRYRSDRDTAELRERVLEYYVTLITEEKK